MVNVPEFFARTHGLVQNNTDLHGPTLTNTHGLTRTNTDLHFGGAEVAEIAGFGGDIGGAGFDVDIPVISVDDLVSSASSGSGVVSTNAAVSSSYNGEKFFGGFGATKLYEVDYWTIRARSAQLFRDNLYARGFIRRYVTNIITTGLMLEAVPEQSVLGLEEDFLMDWAELTENRFALWASNKKLCDYKEQSTFYQLQSIIKREALIEGDILIVIRIDKKTGLPRLQLVPGQSVRSPGTNQKLRNGNTIEHGVELDSARRHVAFWIVQKDGTYKRIPAFESSTGRRLAKMEYGIDKRHEDVRGEPMLSIILQSLKEIDRYRDSAQRKAVINSLMAMFIKRTKADEPKSMPLQTGAVKNSALSVADSNGECRSYQLSANNPGLIAQGLQNGEEPVAMGGGGTDVNLGPFEEVIVSAMSWACEVPPEIMKLAFGTNYAASQAAINEFKLFLNKERQSFGSNVTKDVYEDWCISEALNGTLGAPGFIEAWRDSKQFYKYAAWINSEWNGAVKPTTDLKKLVQAYELMEAKGWITNDLATKELTGTKYTKNLKKQKREVEARVNVRQPEVDQENNVNEDNPTSVKPSAVALDRQTIMAIAEEIAGNIGDMRDEL